MPDADDTERTDDASFRDDAAAKLGDATEIQTNETAEEEDGSSPAEPQPDQYPDPDTEDPGTQPDPVVTTPDDPPPGA